MTETDSIPEKMAELADSFEICRQTFIALGDENRQRIVIALLRNHDSMRVGDIQKNTDLSRPAVSYHLRVLKDAGIVGVLRKGTMNFYHPIADGSQWDKMESLVVRINGLVRETARREADGSSCLSPEKEV